MPARKVCIHNITPKMNCVTCEKDFAKQYRLSNGEVLRAKDRAISKRRYSANRALLLTNVTNNRARKLGVSGILTPEIYLDLVSGPCDYCGLTGLPMEVDHRVPMSKGGTNELSNLHGVCRFCNRSKASFGETEFLTWLNSVKKSA